MEWRAAVGVYAPNELRHRCRFSAGNEVCARGDFGGCGCGGGGCGFVDVREVSGWTDVFLRDIIL
jgi:hypothetical protein